jgi:small conductance mechanosensitive channel
MKWQDTVISFLVQYGFQIVGALLIIIAGWIVAAWTARLLSNNLKRFNLEPPVHTLIVRVGRLLIILMALLVAVQQLGVQIAPIIAGIGVAGVGIGLAMQGVLSNLVAGLTIIFTKPYRVGEYIEIHGEAGQVANIELFTTVLVHADKSRVVIPNRKIVGEILHNYGKMRQLQLIIGVAYDSDLQLAAATLRQVINDNPLVLRDPAPDLGIHRLADSAIEFCLRPWVAVPDYLRAEDDLLEACVVALRKAAITIPFPQRDLHLITAPGLSSSSSSSSTPAAIPLRSA